MKSIMLVLWLIGLVIVLLPGLYFIFFLVTGGTKKLEKKSKILDENIILYKKEIQQNIKEDTETDNKILTDTLEQGLAYAKSQELKDYPDLTDPTLKQLFLRKNLRFRIFFSLSFWIVNKLELTVDNSMQAGAIIHYVLPKLVEEKEIEASFALYIFEKFNNKDPWRAVFGD